MVLGQEDYLQREVTLEVKGVSLKQALDTLSSHSEIDIYYSDDLIPVDKKITLATTKTLREILNLLLRGTSVDFKLIGERLVLVAAEKSVKPADYMIKGYVRDSLSGEELLGATVALSGTTTGVVTNSYGFYSLSLPPGEYDLICSYLGYHAVARSVELSQHTNVDFDLALNAFQLHELVVEASTENDIISGVEMGGEHLSAARIRQMPALLGEVDVVRSMLQLPGVQSVGEGKTGLFVRGARPDQTLIQLDEATVFNAYHVGGLFSVFNPDAIKEVKLYKGGIPVQYGGRSASVLDIRMKEGTKNRLSASGGWGSIASRLTLEGPLGSRKGEKDPKGSFIVSGRRTYLDLLLKLSNDSEVTNNTLFFYDLNAKLNYSINENNRIYISGYTGRDVFRFEDEIGLNWGNLTTTVRWNHVFNNKLFLNTTVLFSNFSYGFLLSDNFGGFDWDSDLRNYSVKADFYHYVNPNLQLDYGYSVIWHHFTPAKILPATNRSTLQPLVLPTENAMEQGLYFSSKTSLSDQWEVALGVRLSLFQNYGPGEFFRYRPGQPISPENVADTVTVDNLDLINTEYGIEPRVSARFKLNSSTSFKASYNRNRQYLHVLTTNNIGFPGDRYKPSDPNLPPQTGNQFSLGFFKETEKNFIFSAEVFYRTLSNVLELNNEPNAIINRALEQQVSIGQSWSYGIELALRKQKGRTFGWLSYTWSRAWDKVPGLNGGRKFHPFYDRTHDVNITVGHRLNERIIISSNWIYNSGQALSFPIGKYQIDGKTVPRFDDNNLNGDRGPAYHRLDFSIEIKGKNKKKRRWQGSWNIALYNVYFRKNSIGFQYRDVINGDPNIEEGDPGVVVQSREFKAVNTYLFRFVPSVTYNFKF